MATVDERGQLVLPKVIRAQAGIRSGDKLAIVTLGRAERWDHAKARVDFDPRDRLVLVPVELHNYHWS